MRYEGVVYRPPSEAYSLIIQATIGCSHNKCNFCSMYKGKKFRIRPVEDIIEDLHMARNKYRKVERIFLADGDALIIPMEKLKAILKAIKEIFPECKRVGVYGSPKSILIKSIDDLIELRALGIGIVYLGIESGSDKILKEINKGVLSEEIITAGRKIKECGIKLSVTLISGLGGKENIREHALESALVINKINPDYLGFLTLMIEENTELYNKVKSGEFKLLNPKEVMEEMKIFIENINVENTVFRSNHASNYVSLKGTLPLDKENILNTINATLKDSNSYKSEFLRGL
ncbi:MAG: radical SAM protein [Clostridium argentinense]|uniref:Radical SAM protein n=1 Tax=Clostridium faecium TaxID=2762223 RepID=A0ABR8YNS7_9CLOT|nr:radical SAM protein [Clostridium faecium]MBD8045875.1 radical SAM protein [Clostridium faecium]MBS5824172.1 radical SAM protein [Clostridium argentinense]